MTLRGVSPCEEFVSSRPFSAANSSLFDSAALPPQRLAEPPLPRAHDYQNPRPKSRRGVAADDRKDGPRSSERGRPSNRRRAGRLPTPMPTSGRFDFNARRHTSAAQSLAYLVLLKGFVMRFATAGSLCSRVPAVSRLRSTVTQTSPAKSLQAAQDRAEAERGSCRFGRLCRTIL